VRIRPDPFIVALLVTAAVAVMVPAQGEWLDGFQVATKVAIALLFFLYGARLSTADALSGLRSWRLHAATVGVTFVAFPLIGVALRVLRPDVLSPELYAGVLLLCLVPSTVQSSIAFTGIARGNVAGAVVSASLSNVLGVFLTPLLVAVLMHNNGSAGVGVGAVGAIALQLLVPFALGQLSRPFIGAWATRHDQRLRLYDRSSILLIVYVAFSQGTNADVWSQLDLPSLAGLLAVCVGLLTAVMALTVALGRALSFSRGDRIALFFCGSKKSLASGLPMATVLFTGHNVALIILPLMLFHQIQLIVCAFVAARLARTAPNPSF